MFANKINGSLITNDDTLKTVELPITIRLPEIETSPEIVPPVDGNAALALSNALEATTFAALALAKAASTVMLVVLALLNTSMVSETPAFALENAEMAIILASFALSNARLA